MRLITLAESRETESFVAKEMVECNDELNGRDLLRVHPADDFLLR